jgi:hypothetical protein
MAPQRTAARSDAPVSIGAPAMPRARRGVRSIKAALRLIRNLLAFLGFCFVLLLWLGYTQYQERVDAGDLACTLTHCA